MSRSTTSTTSTTPEAATLSKEDKLILANVRRSIWSSAVKGMGYGSIGCFLTHSVALMAQNRGMFKGGLNRNTAMLAFLGGGSLGSFLMASTTGKNEVHNLHPIFEIGQNKREIPDGLTEYQRSMHKSKHQQPSTTTEFVQGDELPQELKKNRITRRKTLQGTIDHGHGLSDSHGGQWADDKK